VVGVDEQPDDSIDSPNESEDFESQTKSKKKPKKWYTWFRSASFWKMTTIYTLARMFINVTQVYMPIYLQHYLRLPKSTVAIIPLTTYIASFVFSFIRAEELWMFDKFAHLTETYMQTL